MHVSPNWNIIPGVTESSQASRRLGIAATVTIKKGESARLFLSLNKSLVVKLWRVKLPCDVNRVSKVGKGRYATWIEPSFLHIFHSWSSVHPMSCCWYDIGYTVDQLPKTGCSKHEQRFGKLLINNDHGPQKDVPKVVLFLCMQLMGLTWHWMH